MTNQYAEATVYLLGQKVKVTARKVGTLTAIDVSANGHTFGMHSLDSAE